MNCKTRIAFTLIVASLLPISAYANRPDAPGIKAQVAKIYKPYQSKADDRPWWKYPIYSAETRKLITRWEAARKGSEDELGSASDADWLCACQDFDPKKFRVTADIVQVLPSGKSQATITIHQGWGESSKQRLIMVKEKGRWEVDDILDIDANEGMQAALRADIAAMTKRK
jgi:Protein of unknown function (DUF3828)